MYTHGVVVGKFWPPHKGHLHLISEASSQCSILDVFVIESFGETPSGDVRKNWIQEELSDLKNIYVKVVPNLPPGYDDDSVAWARYTKALTGGFTPDAVFTSETYGDTWAAALGCDHVQVDLERGTHPVSGTKVRTDPMSVWDYIPRSIRPYYTKKVLIIGGESTGKTTLAGLLAKHYNTKWVEEYGRIYCELNGTDTNDPMIWPLILINQPELEDRAARKGNGLIFCDTDLLTTSVWYEDWRGVRDSMYHQIVEAGKKRKYDLVLFCDHNDVPWVDDGTRVAGDKREWFSDQLEAWATVHTGSYTILDGDWDNRFKVARQTVDAFLRQGTDEPVSS